MSAQSDFDILAHNTQVLAAETVPEVWALHVKAMKHFRFDKLLYGSTRYRTHGMLGDIDDALILSEGPQAYLDVYIGDELYLDSAANDWASKNTGSASWLDIAMMYSDRELTPKRLRLMQLNAEHGVICGYTISLNETSSHGQGTIGLSPEAGLVQADADHIWAQHGAQIEMLCNLMHLKISTLPQAGQRRPLTSRQREALEWYATGKTTQDIATIMGLSAATIEKHLKSARDSLNVQTTAHAVQKATTLNLLFV